MQFESPDTITHVHMSSHIPRLHPPALEPGNEATHEATTITITGTCIYAALINSPVQVLFGMLQSPKLQLEDHDVIQSTVVAHCFNNHTHSCRLAGN